MPSLNDPPKPTDDIIPTSVPLDVLQGWDLNCGVSPSEITPEALLQDKVPDDNTEA